VTIARTLDLREAEEICGDVALQRVRRAWDELQPGDVLEVRAIVAEHAWVVRAWARKTNKPIVEERTDGPETIIRLQKPADG
jgi:TusA-related sulfurtransferase